MNYLLITPGLDPTQLPGDVTKGNLLTLVQDIQFVQGVGAEIEADSAPDVVVYPLLKHYRWAKTSGGARTGEFYWYDGSSWTLERPAVGTIDGDTFVNNSIPISKLSCIGETPYHVIRVNSDASAFEFVSIGDAILAGTITPEKLADAANVDYIPISDVSGVFEYRTFGTVFQSYLGFASLPYEQVTATGGSALAGQVVYFPATTGPASVGWADQLLRANQVATSKLAYPVGSAGKLLRVNAGGTDLEVAGTVPTAAVVWASKAVNTAGQLVNTADPTEVELTNATPSTSIVTLASNRMTLGAGTYLVDVVMPLFGLADDYKVQMQLYNNTTSAIMATASVIFTSGGDTAIGNLKHAFTLSTSATVSVRVQQSVAKDLYLGSQVNIGGLAEVYTQVSILKLT